MKKYIVEVRVSKVYEIEVKALSERVAIGKAEKIARAGEGTIYETTIESEVTETHYE